MASGSWQCRSTNTYHDEGVIYRDAKNVVDALCFNFGCFLNVPGQVRLGAPGSESTRDTKDDHLRGVHNGSELAIQSMVEYYEPFCHGTNQPCSPSCSGNDDTQPCGVTWIHTIEVKSGEGSSGFTHVFAFSCRITSGNRSPATTSRNFASNATDTRKPTVLVTIIHI